jgi:Na+/melibiose symporter-like transporter
MHYHQEFFGFIWMFIWIGFVLFYSYFNRRERMHLYDLADKAASEGRTLPPEIFGRLRRRVYTWQSDIRIGVILLAVSAGLVAAGLLNYYDYSQGHPNAELFYGPFKMFPIPGLIGVAFVIMGLIRRRDEMKDR